MKAIQQMASYVFLYVCILSLLPKITTPLATRTQAEALIQWKNSFSSSSTIDLRSWSTNYLDNLCNWTGIVCVDNNTTRNRVSQINISSMRINGTLAHFNFTPFVNLTHFILKNNFFDGSIPSAIGNLSSLTFLDLSSNYFEGEIPLQITNLTELQYLSFRDNRLNGIIPPQISNLQKVWFLDFGINHLRCDDNWSRFSGFPSLTSLSLNSNNMVSEFPPFISDSQSLTFIDLSHNFFVGQIPESVFTNLTKLEFLNLSSNQLNGTLSSNIFELTQLQHLYLAQNHFVGSIPENIDYAANLQILDLSSNFFKGKIPSFIGSLKHLYYLDLRGNLLDSTIPSEVGFCTNITFLALGGNRLIGELPLSLSNLRQIAELDLSNNMLSGPLFPELISNWTELTSLQLQMNRFHGRIPSELRLLTKLTDLLMNQNKFSGPIPSEIGRIKGLKGLQLNGNQLLGSIPLEIGNLKNLSVLDLSGNHIYGPIPTIFSSLTNLVNFNLSDNNINGTIPPEIGNLYLLERLGLSLNNLNGEIPAELAKLRCINSLDLSSNSLSGEIPAELGELLTLQNLNVSHNHLSGEIPQSLSLLYLFNIDFSYNFLKGPIPSSTFFKNAPRTAYVGNPGLVSNVNSSIPIPMSKDNGTKKILIAILVPICALSVFALVATIAIKYKLFVKETNNDRNDENYKLMIWSREEKMTLQDITKATENFNDKYCIGKGGFGSVYKVILPSGLTVAVKLMKCSETSAKLDINCTSFLNEIQALTEIRHRNIIKFYGFCSLKGSMYLVYAYAERGSLRKALYGVEEERELSWARRVEIAHGLANAVSYLHHDCSPPIVHRDISLNNILIDHDFVPCLSDFGVAKILTSNSFIWSTVLGTIGYIAPELAQTVRVTNKCDVYCFGVVALELMMGKHPAELLEFVPMTLSRRNSNNDVEVLLLKDVLDQRLQLPTGELAREVVLVMTIALACTQATPETRPSMCYVAQELSARRHGHLPEPLSMITIKKVLEDSKKYTN